MATELKNERESMPPQKRFRRNEHADPTNPAPSPVVHVRNLHPKVTEADLIEALGTFGLISYVTVVPAQRMALVEFEDIKAARDCVSFAASNLIFVAGEAALFNYSTSQNVQRSGFESENPCKVLVVTVYNTQSPIDVHVFHQICKPYAKVVRIAIVRKSVMQALVEFESAEDARKVKHAINGADIYSGSCTLKVEFAKQGYVKITRQDADQWDYTLPEGLRGYDLWRRPREVKLRKVVQLVMSIWKCSQTSKKDTAMAELGTPTAVDNAMKYLQGITLFGLTLQLKRSMQTAVKDVTVPFDLPDGSSAFRDFSMLALQRFSTPDAAARNRLIFPTKVLHFYNAPVEMDEQKIREASVLTGAVFSKRGAPELKSVTVFIGRSDRSSSGFVELESVEKANEALALVNHAPIVSPHGKTPYILKMAYAASRQSDDPSGDANGGEDAAGGPPRGGLRGGLRGSGRFVKVLMCFYASAYRVPFDLPDGSSAFRDFSMLALQRFSTPDAAARETRYISLTKVCSFFISPVEMAEQKYRSGLFAQVFSKRGAPELKSVTVFIGRSDRSSSGFVELESVEKANEALALVNHAPIVSPHGKTPYILKMAYAASRQSDDPSGDANGGEDAAGGPPRGGLRGGLRGSG
ncbi:hnRNP-L/PTB/hephaestus splicing factor family protein, partial [Ostertagia ostertagi]